ncbi:MAG: adenylyltransferase/cytidyltransferase family protein [Francisellaceae bacterium]|jgi:cytidyltransferase-like protein|nr:adenylyltransferase/cytidyltransferase family protein [Francisellaceae bacterium]MBT6208092.1 adenylyltransferase/cytidyltransferase family protein [Francisellaceae bacterium]MBT6538142.1 adenylyltransferase/cytidyltransferase family protein [Francisellaceae bacterium]
MLKGYKDILNIFIFLGVIFFSHTTKAVEFDNLVSKLNIVNVSDTIQLQEELKHEDKIGIYVGSFDPVHNGHIEAMEQALQEKNLHFIIVLSNTPSRSKPSRTDYSIRLHMLNLAFIGNKRILVANNETDEAIKILKQHHKLVGIIGSDQVIRHLKINKPPKQYVDEWFIVTRDADREHLPMSLTTFFGKPCSYANKTYLQQQHLSSSDIRDLLSKQEPFKKGNLSLPVPKSVEDFIYNDYLYSKSKHNVYNTLYDLTKKIAYY